MIQITHLDHRFVEHIPDQLQSGLLYISLEYGSVAHRCCCGCGEEIVTPLSPTDWKMIYDGESVSLTPSIGNWKLPCRSHYIIKQGRAIESLPWTDEQVEAELRRDRAAKAAYYGRQAEPAAEHSEPKEPDSGVAADNVWQKVFRWLKTTCRL